MDNAIAKARIALGCPMIVPSYDKFLHSFTTEGLNSNVASS